MTHYPFRYLNFRLPSTEDSETDENIVIVHAWVGDIQDPRKIKTIIDWGSAHGFGTNSFAHLRSVRKRTAEGVATISFLVCAASQDQDVPPLSPSEKPNGLTNLRVVPVPAFPARTKIQLMAKNEIWPTLYAPKYTNEYDIHEWNAAEVDWVRTSLARAVAQSKNACIQGDIAVASYVSVFGSSTAFFANDTRKSASHPLHHSVMNVIRQVADYFSSRDTAPSDDFAKSTSDVGYLLTGFTLFTTHEPCIMCSMALVHSRVSQIFFIHSMPKTGGCGGSTAITGLKGVNHRYDVYQWVAEGIGGIESLLVDQNIDA